LWTSLSPSLSSSNRQHHHNSERNHRRRERDKAEEMVNVVELQKQLQRWQQSGNNNVNVDANGELMYVQVMTDEQLETLRKQIAVYGTICDQLIEMHRTLSAQQDLAGPSSFLPLFL